VQEAYAVMRMAPGEAGEMADTSANLPHDLSNHGEARRHMEEKVLGNHGQLRTS
jgi:hypothetical protein